MNDASTINLSVSKEHPVRWIVVGQLLDTRNQRVLKSVHLVYNDERILFAGTTSPPPTLTGTKQAPDSVLPDFTALPGLIEGHSHVFLEGGELDAEKRAAYQGQDADTLYGLAESRIQTVARLGIVAMRDGGDKDFVGLRLSQRGTQSHLPPVFSPGPGIYHQGRYGSFFGIPLEDDPDIETCVRNRIAAGASHIKIVPTGIINFAKGMVVAQPQFTTHEILHVTQTAHSQQRQVMAHASGEAGIGVAIDGQVDTIEHGFFITDDQLRKMRDQNIAWLPTFAPVHIQVEQADRMGWKGDTLENLKRILANHAISLQKALQLGVRVRVGSDAGSYGVPHGTGLLLEMELLEQAGMPTIDLLCRATFGNRDLLPDDLPYGALEPGFRPNMILSRLDLLASIRNLSNERWVISHGVALHSSTVILSGL